MKNKLIKYTDEIGNGKVINLIPVHINKMRCENFFWHWSSNYGDWIRTEEISEELKKAYKTPMLKSNYK